jgi:hypothetical protein
MLVAVGPDATLLVSSDSTTRTMVMLKVAATAARRDRCDPTAA